MDFHCDTDTSSLCSCFDWRFCVTKYGNLGWNEINDDVFTWIIYIFSSICDNYSSVRKSLKVSSLSLIYHFIVPGQKHCIAGSSSRECQLLRMFTFELNWNHCSETSTAHYQGFHTAFTDWRYEKWGVQWKKSQCAWQTGEGCVWSFAVVLAV